MSALSEGCPYPAWWISVQCIIISSFIFTLCHCIYSLWIFIKNKIQETSKIKYAIPLAITAICTAAFVFIFDITTYLCTAICNGVFSKWFGISIVSFLFSYALHNLLLLVIIFVKLESVFIGTTYEISKITVRIYKTIFIILPILMLNWPIGFMFPPIRQTTFYIGSIILFIVLLIHLSMVILIIYKLIQVYRDTIKSATDDNEHIFGAITKLTILSSMTLTMTLSISAIILWQAITFHQPSTAHFFIYAVFRFLDGYTTFLSTIMCYKTFNGNYEVICKFMDIRCGTCWKRIISNGTKSAENIRHLEEIVNAKVTSTTGNVEVQAQKNTMDTTTIKYDE